MYFKNLWAQAILKDSDCIGKVLIKTEDWEEVMLAYVLKQNHAALKVFIMQWQDSLKVNCEHIPLLSVQSCNLLIAIERIADSKSLQIIFENAPIHPLVARKIMQHCEVALSSDLDDRRREYMEFAQKLCINVISGVDCEATRELIESSKIIDNTVDKACDCSELVPEMTDKEARYLIMLGLMLPEDEFEVLLDVNFSSLLSCALGKTLREVTANAKNLLEVISIAVSQMRHPEGDNPITRNIKTLMKRIGQYHQNFCKAPSSSSGFFASRNSKALLNHSQITHHYDFLHKLSEKNDEWSIEQLLDINFSLLSRDISSDSKEVSMNAFNTFKAIRGVISQSQLTHPEDCNNTALNIKV